MSDYNLDREIEEGLKRSEEMLRRQKVTRAVLWVAGIAFAVLACVLVAFISFTLGQNLSASPSAPTFDLINTSTPTATEILPTVTPVPSPSITPLPILPIGADSPDWPMEGHDIRRTSFNLAESHLNPPLKLLWQKKLSSFYPDQMTVWGNQLALAGMEAINNHNQVMMLNTTTNDVLWEYVLPNGGGGAMSIAPVQDGANVFFGGQGDTKIYALNANSGDLSWIYGDTQGFYASDMAVYGDLLLIPDEANGDIAFDSGSGTPMWGAPSNAWGLPLASDGDLVFTVSGGRDTLIARDLNTHLDAWQYPGLTSYFTWLAVDNDAIYLNLSETEVASLNTKTGIEIWKKSLGIQQLQGGSAGLAYDKLFVPVWKNKLEHGGLLALDASTGDQLWEFDTDAEGVLSIAIANHVVYVSGWSASMLYALSVDTGEVLWTFPLNCNGGNVVVSRGILYIAACQNIYAFSSE